MEKKIIIVGAGASGVAAATKLISNGFKNVTILEAGNRIGGRVNTIPFGANVVDMGAQWCHGEKNNVVYEMAKDKNLLEHSTTKQADQNLIRSTGEEIPKEFSVKLCELANEIYEGDKYDEERAAYPGSMGNFFAKKYKEELKNEAYNDIDPGVAHESYDLFQKQMSSMDGTDSWYHTSCNSREYETCEGDFNMNWKDKGYVSVFDLLQNKIPGDDQHPVIDIIPMIVFNKSVKKITYSHPSGSAELIKVECEDGSTFTADHLICTVSLGVLKARHMSMFDPILPQAKVDSIDGMDFGTVAKIYLEFDKPFWNKDWAGFSALWKLEQLKEAREDPVNGDWLEGLMGYYFFNPLQPNVICGWLVGELARNMERKSDADVKAGAEKFLRMFLKERDIPDAKAMVRSKWGTNPLFRGVYSSYSLKGDALDASTHKLAEPITDSNGKPMIQFAGEGTSFKYFSCVHGAVESGWREADRLINFYM